jgi:type III secretion protein J
LKRLLKASALNSSCKASAARIALAALLALTACRERIVHDLSENEVNRLMTTLSEIPLKSEKIKQADGRWALAVAKRDVMTAIKYLSRARLLQRTTPNRKERGRMIPSREDQRFEFERALSREIEYTLTSVEGVLEARVHLNLPVRDPLFGRPLDEQAGGTASVLLVATPDFALSKEEISLLVSGASGVAPNAIAVLLSGGGPEPAAAPGEETRLNAAPAKTPIAAGRWLRAPGLQIAAVLLLLGFAGLWTAHKLSNRKIGCS